MEATEPRRRYDSRRRRQQAQAARDRVVEVAHRAFLEGGYAAPTVASIASQAGVSVDTIYKTFAGKAGLLRAVYATALRGTQPVPAEQRSDAMQAREPDPQRLIAAWAQFVAELAPRAAPIVLLIREAAPNDAGLRSLLEEIDEARLQRMRENARRLAAAGHLRPGVSVEEAALILWTYSSPELFELLVLRRRMTLEAYREFIASAMVGALLQRLG